MHSTCQFHLLLSLLPRISCAPQTPTIAASADGEHSCLEAAEGCGCHLHSYKCDTIYNLYVPPLEILAKQVLEVWLRV